MTPYRSDIRLSDPTLEDLRHIARNMRKSDQREIYCTLWHENPDVFANHCWVMARNRVVAYVLRAFDDDDPIAFFGVIWVTPATGAAFMFGTDKFPKIMAGLSFFIKEQVIPAVVETGLGRVECRAMKDNKTTCRWILWLGAREETELPNYGKNGETFIQFAWRKEDVLFFGKGTGRTRSDAVAASPNPG